MKQNKGFALLVVLALQLLAGIFVMHRLFITGLRCDVALQREQWHNHFYLADSVLNLGIMIAKNNFDALVPLLQGKKDPIILKMLSSSFMEDAPLPYAALIITMFAEKVDDPRLIVRAVCYQKEDQMQDYHTHEHMSLACMLTKRTVQKNNKQETRFVVSHFTIGADV
jgi:hypothetical protein